MPKTFESLLGLGDGDGRDNKLYAHKFKIMSIANYRQVLRFINSHILAEPFNEDDFQRIAREEEIKTEKDSEPEVAKHLIRVLRVVKYNEKLYSYNGFRYVCDEFTN